MTSYKANDSVGWLHVTDLHQGVVTQSHLWPNVRARLYEDLDRLHKKCGPWDIVLFTGDLTQRGKPIEFAALTRTLDDLLAHLKNLGSNPVLCPVPGNHDLQRPKSSSSNVLALSQFHSNEDLRNAFFGSKPDERRRCVAQAFKAFQAWATAYPAFARAAPTHGLLPGDFAFKLALPTRLRLGVIGLNTAFLQLTGGDFEERLSCDARQLVRVCDGDPDRWLADCDVALLLTHHPPSWLDPRALRGFFAEIARPGRFLAHFYGHMHESRASATALGGSTARNEMQGASLFGLEHYQGRNGVEIERRHGFSAGRISLTGDKAVMSVFPRAMVAKQDGSFEIEADPSATLQDEAFQLSAPRLRSIGSKSRPGPATSAASSAGSSPVTEVVNEYRQRLASWYERWDLSFVGLAQADSSVQRVVARLDEMYQPLRFIERSPTGATQGGNGTVVGIKEILSSLRPLMVRGAAGAGKTTWLQHSFRALLESDDTLPLMLVLRDLAQRWRSPGCRGKARSLDAFLHDWVAQNLPAFDPGFLDEVLRNDSGVRPVLLIDGWDEVGPLGEELRSKLTGFLQQHPRVLAVVTSRPYGESPPSDSDGFRCFDIAPLTKDEMTGLATRFFQHCSGEDVEARQRLQRRFLQGLERSTAAQDMGQTPLLLVIMLLISRSRPLPDKRHLLYQVCVDGLLSAMPDAKQDEGALLSRYQYRPDDSEERMQLAASLAAGPGIDGKFVALVGTAEQLAERLRADWPAKAPVGMTKQQARIGFIRWLAGPAGLLNERTDGTLTFSHLSFQEYLTAWHLNAVVEGAEARARAVIERHCEPTWWETLRLWTALIGGQSQLRLTPVLQGLIEAGSDGLCLCGAILADGLGVDDLFQSWMDAFVDHLCLDWPATVSLCIDGWRASRQEERRQRFSECVRLLMPHVVVPAWLRLAQLCDRLGWQSVLADEPAHLGSFALRWLSDARIQNFAELAAGRVLCSSHPLWPGEPLSVAMLHLWPSPRRMLGINLQAAVLCGAVRADLVQLLRAWLAPVPAATPELIARATRRAAKFAEDLALNSADPMVPDISTDWAWQLSCGQVDFPPDATAEEDIEDATKVYQRDWVRPYAEFLYGFVDASGEAQILRRAHALAINEGRAALQVHDHQFACSWSKGWACAPAPSSAEDLALHWHLDHVPRWLKDLGRFVYHSSARFGTRALVAVLTDFEPPFGLMAHACRLALCPDSDPAKFSQLLASYPADGDQLWPMLARHIAGHSTSDDRVQLESLVRQPESRKGIISWGLRYLARGDVILADGSEFTLDELAAEAGCPPIPFLQASEPPPRLLGRDMRQLLQQFGAARWGILPMFTIVARNPQEWELLHQKQNAVMNEIISQPPWNSEEAE